MKKNLRINLLFLFLFVATPLFAQDVTTITANSDDVSDNLDLEAVASIFGDSKDLEDFEKRLNDPKTQISNLDLNNDGEVDYLRVMETSENNVHSISIQAVIGKDQYQEVAVIDVQKDSKGSTQVQVVGNVDMYGPNYYITPYYPVVPVFFTLFLGCCLQTLVLALVLGLSPTLFQTLGSYFAISLPYKCTCACQHQQHL